jgi:hypothetical protein
MAKNPTFEKECAFGSFISLMGLGVGKATRTKIVLEHFFKCENSLTHKTNKTHQIPLVSLPCNSPMHFEIQLQISNNALNIFCKYLP